MTEPSAQRPVPGPPRPGPSPTPAPAPRPSPTADQESHRAPEERPQGGTAEQARARLAGLEGLPVGDHVAVFEAEHERLQRELGTIDPL